LFPLERESSQISVRKKKIQKTLLERRKLLKSCVKKIQCNELSFLFCVELPTQYSPEVGKTKAKTFYTKVKNSTNEFLWKQI
jgi:hypothetical protein